MPVQTVFVYGTLQRGNTRRGLDQFDGVKFVSKAATQEGTLNLIDLGSFPAAVPGGDSDIAGEVWQLTDPNVMEQLDWIEGYPHFYSRRLVETTSGTAWMYYIRNPDEYTYTLVEPQGGICTWQGL